MKEDIEKVNTRYIHERLEENGLIPADLVDFLGIDKSTISLLLNNYKPLTKWHKATFYYFFKALYYRNVAKGYLPLKE